jgi:hypothetical protein
LLIKEVLKYVKYRWQANNITNASSCLAATVDHWPNADFETGICTICQMSTLGNGLLMGDEHQNPQTYPSNRMHLPVNHRVDC